MSKRIRIASELYEILERKAKGEGKTVRDLVCDIVLKRIQREQK